MKLLWISLIMIAMVLAASVPGQCYSNIIAQQTNDANPIQTAICPGTKTAIDSGIVLGSGVIAGVGTYYVASKLGASASKTSIASMAQGALTPEMGFHEGIENAEPKAPRSWPKEKIVEDISLEQEKVISTEKVSAKEVTEEVEKVISAKTVPAKEDIVELTEKITEKPLEVTPQNLNRVIYPANDPMYDSCQGIEKAVMKDPFVDTASVSGTVDEELATGEAGSFGTLEVETGLPVEISEMGVNEALAFDEAVVFNEAVAFDEAVAGDSAISAAITEAMTENVAIASGTLVEGAAIGSVASPYLISALITIGAAIVVIVVTATVIYILWSAS